MGFDDGIAGFYFGDEEREDCAVVDRMLGGAIGETTVVASDDTGGDPETKAGAVEIFSGVEGFEEACLHGWRHAVAGVGDGDAKTGTRGVRVC